MIGLLVVILSVGGVLTNQTSSDCGRRATTSTTLVDGEEVRSGELPWNIHVHCSSSRGWVYRCSGTLITPTHVITSASCVSDLFNDYKKYPAADLTLAANKASADFNTTEPNSQLLGVTSVIRHERYDRSDRLNDIAILVANQSFVLSSHVTVACLDWSKQLPTPSSTDELIGAAWDLVNKVTGKYLVAAEHYHLIGEDSCRASLRSTVVKYVTDDKYCARPASNETCSDTVGGGLMLQQDGRHYLLGVVSSRLYGERKVDCDVNVNRLNTCTNITQFMPWIQRQTFSISH